MMVPAWQAPRPLPHASPTPGSVPPAGGLSIWPSQLSSRPLQTSCCGAAGGALQIVSVPAALQTRWPMRLHWPMSPLLHVAPTGPLAQLLLSMMPSQLLSIPSQISGGTAQPQGPPQALGGSPSSTLPLQLSSMQLQVSIWQWRGVPPFCPITLSGSVGLLGLMTKLPQAAMVFPGVQRLHWFDTPSSMRLLQLSSLPLQISAGGTFWAMTPTMELLAALASFRETRIEAPVPPAAAMASLALSAVVSVMT